MLPILQSLQTIDPTLFVKEGATINMLSCLARIFKLAKRETLSRHVASVKALLDDKNIMASENIAIRKLSMKLVQRIGLSFLPANLAPWRHLRTVKHLADNLTTDAPKTELAFPNVLEGENTVIPEDIEDVIDKLLQGLMDAGKEIRWAHCPVHFDLYLHVALLGMNGCIVILFHPVEDLVFGYLVLCLCAASIVAKCLKTCFRFI